MWYGPSSWDFTLTSGCSSYTTRPLTLEMALKGVFDSSDFLSLLWHASSFYSGSQAQFLQF